MIVILSKTKGLVNYIALCHGLWMDDSVRKWMANKELFLAELAKGRKWELYVAECLQGIGFNAIVPPKGDYTMPHDPKYANSHDINVNGRIVEVKSRNLDFSTPESFPFATIYVKTKASYDAMTDKPAMCVVVSQISGNTLALDVSRTEKLWKPVRFFDSVRKISTTAYECDKMEWEPLDVVAERVL
jgi:hypothetical protein